MHCCTASTPAALNRDDWLLATHTPHPFSAFIMRSLDSDDISQILHSELRESILLCIPSGGPPMWLASLEKYPTLTCPTACFCMLGVGGASPY